MTAAPLYIMTRCRKKNPGCVHFTWRMENRTTTPLCGIVLQFGSQSVIRSHLQFNIRFDTTKKKNNRNEGNLVCLLCMFSSDCIKHALIASRLAYVLGGIPSPPGVNTHTHKKQTNTTFTTPTNGHRTRECVNSLKCPDIAGALIVADVCYSFVIDRWSHLAYAVRSYRTLHYGFLRIGVNSPVNDCATNQVHCNPLVHRHF